MHVLGVDGGNTKTLAVVVRSDGTILGAGSAGRSDIYNASTENAALEEIRAASLAATADAGLVPQDLAGAAFSLAGADWPEDHELYRVELRRRLRLATPPTVVNDAVGGLWAGSPDGVGVSVVCGTAGAVGGRGRDGRVWHASFWLGSSGAIALVRSAMLALNRAALGLDPATSLTRLVPAFFGEPTPEALLHRLTRRVDRAEWSEIARAAPVVLDAADGGDRIARRLVADCGAQLGDYALVAARQVGLVDGRLFPLVLAGGVLRHPSPLLTDAIVERVEASAPSARPVFADLPPAAGAALLALHEAGVVPGEDTVEHLRSTLSDRDPRVAVPGW